MGGVGALVVVELVDGSLVSLVLLTSGVVAAIVRGLLTLREDQHEADALLGSSAQERERFAALVEASSDFIAIAEAAETTSALAPTASGTAPTASGTGEGDRV